MRQTSVPHKATRCTKLRGAQHPLELALRSTDFRAPENLIFPAMTCRFHNRFVTPRSYINDILKFKCIYIVLDN